MKEDLPTIYKGKGGLSFHQPLRYGIDNVTAYGESDRRILTSEETIIHAIQYWSETLKECDIDAQEFLVIGSTPIYFNKGTLLVTGKEIDDLDIFCPENTLRKLCTLLTSYPELFPQAERVTPPVTINSSITLLSTNLRINPKHPGNTTRIRQVTFAPLITEVKINPGHWMYKNEEPFKIKFDLGNAIFFNYSQSLRDLQTGDDIGLRLAPKELSIAIKLINLRKKDIAHIMQPISLGFVLENSIVEKIFNALVGENMVNLMIAKLKEIQEMANTADIIKELGGDRTEKS